jgi:hypothetical protein
MMAHARWLAAAGVLVMLALGVHGIGAYRTILSIDAGANLPSANAYTLFDDLTTNGVRVPSGVQQADRQRYTQALEQLVLDGTGVCLGVALLVVAAYSYLATTL